MTGYLFHESRLGLLVLLQVDEAAKISSHFTKCLNNTKTEEMPYGCVLKACYGAFFFPRFFLAGILQLFFVLVRKAH